MNDCENIENFIEYEEQLSGDKKYLKVTHTDNGWKAYVPRALKVEGCGDTIIDAINQLETALGSME